MIKFIFYALFCVVLLGCSGKNDSQYYRLHPEELQKAIAKCSMASNSAVDCQELKDIAIKINTMAYELNMDPQGFGQKILALQTSLIELKARCKKEPHNIELKELLVKTQRELRQRLAIVKWLEAPGG